MRLLFVLGLALVIAGLVVLVVGNQGAGISWSSVIAGGVLFVLGGTMALSAHMISSALARDAAAVRELETTGVRRTGTVRDVVPLTVPGATTTVIQADGAQLVVSIELDKDNGGTERVTCHLVEDTETAKARIGTRITVIEHPHQPALRAIDGYLPNGRRRA